MSENQSEGDFEDLLNSLIPTRDEGMGKAENGADVRQRLTENQQPLTTAQRQSIRELDAALGLEPEGLPSQIVQAPSNATADQGGFNFSPHAPLHREADDPANMFLGQASSIPLFSNLPHAQQSAGNRPELNPPNPILAQSSSVLPQSLPQSSLPSGQQAAHKVLQLLPGLTLEQAHLIIEASRAGVQAAPVGVVRDIPEDDNPSRPLGENSQMNEVHRLSEIQDGCIDRTDLIPHDVHGKTRNSTRNETNPVTHGRCIYNQQGFPSGEAQQNVKARDTEPGIPTLSRGMNIQTGTMNQPENSTLHQTLKDAVRLLHQSDTPVPVQRPLGMNINSPQNNVLPFIEMNARTGSAPLPETPAHQNTNAESQLLNQLNAPILPQIPLGVNNQTSVQHQPGTGIHDPIFNNTITQQDEGNPLLASKLPSRPSNQAIFENPPDIQVHQQMLNSADVQRDSLPESDLSSPSGRAVNAAGIESEVELGRVSHSDEHCATLQWISDFIKDASPPFIATMNELDNEESQSVADVQNQTPGTSSQANPPVIPSANHPIGLEQAHIPGFRELLGSSYEKVIGGKSDPMLKFSAHFTRLRSENASHSEMSKAIAVPELPLLDEEMVLDSKYTGSDTVRWRAEERNSPTISKITCSIRQSAQGTVVPVEALFNHLFCLFRRSFLQREEKVHLELTTLFLKNSRLEGETNCQNDAKELICWLERTFSRGHLAQLIQRLVIAIDDSPAMKFLVDRAKRNYNPRNTEMTILGTFYELMSKQHDILKTKQELAKKKQEVDKDIREVKKTLKDKNIKAPKTTYEKKKTRNSEQGTEMDHGLIRTFNATKWMLVECTDSHYAYAQSMLEASKLTRTKTKAERDETLEILNGGISSLETRNETPEIVASLKEMKESREQVSQRDVSVIESTVLGCFVETMLALGKVTVSALLRTIGKLPSRLALTLEAAGEELEKVRGMGSGEKPGVEDIVRVAKYVEEEKENNAKQRRIISKKASYLQECQQLLNGGVDPGGGPA